ncbi:phage repressor protein CI [Pantoea dispersa]|uniref:phage repressor protein CI n=1 Tax=Pantoea dispersa TaxID=59814 RepID=UPI0024B6717D|nr:phage repressor protein CI [Pantoea dispersa]MDI9768607.1 phage repressor protein CI [Pantoea dispersa]
MKFDIDFEGDSAPILDRVIEAYGFSTKMLLADHLGMAPSTLSGRYKRGGFPADIVVRCMAETGVQLQWLVTGKGKKFDNDELDILNLPRKKLVDGQLYDSGYAMFDKAFFRPGVPLPSDPFCLIDDKNQYIIDRKYEEVFDGEWLVNIEGKVGIRNLVRIPIKKVRVSGVGMAFDCGIDDINILGRVVLSIMS